MHIEEVTIEGFKSYAKRVVVTQFDSSFNAITGLNGSGKSNILDAICFVLGIKNLSHVRAPPRAEPEAEAVLRARLLASRSTRATRPCPLRRSAQTMSWSSCTSRDRPVSLRPQCQSSLTTRTPFSRRWATRTSKRSSSHGRCAHITTGNSRSGSGREAHQ